MRLWLISKDDITMKEYVDKMDEESEDEESKPDEKKFYQIETKNHL